MDSSLIGLFLKEYKSEFKDANIGGAVVRYEE